MRRQEIEEARKMQYDANQELFKTLKESLSKIEGGR
jgi:hypothetical protein